MAARGVLAGVPVSRLLPRAGLDDLLLVASTEINTAEDRAAFVAALEGATVMLDQPTHFVAAPDDGKRRLRPSPAIAGSIRKSRCSSKSAGST